jgi:hypothetical protein
VPFGFINLILQSMREVMRLNNPVAPETATIRPGLELPVDQSQQDGCGKLSNP